MSGVRPKGKFGFWIPDRSLLSVFAFPVLQSGDVGGSGGQIHAVPRAPSPAMPLTAHCSMTGPTDAQCSTVWVLHRVGLRILPFVRSTVGPIASPRPGQAEGRSTRPFCISQPLLQG
jgi:hypothetical protein